MNDDLLEDRRLAFGRVAERYDRVRPSYPAPIVDRLIELSGLRPADRVLEVGAGTGQLTVPLAGRGLDVVALEPSAAMAQLARGRCTLWTGVEVIEAEFETWEPLEPFAAVVSGAAWHWIAPASRYELAARALKPDGSLAALWTFPDWERCAGREVLSAAYGSAAPALRAEFPMHPDSDPTRLAGDWHAEIAASTLFEDPMVDTHAWSAEYTSERYTMLLGTHQDHILLGDAARAALFGAITAAIDAAGGVLTMPFLTRLCVARRRG